MLLRLQQNRKHNHGAKNRTEVKTTIHKNSVENANAHSKLKAHKGNNGAHVMQNHYISDMVCICDNNSANNQKVSACGTARMCSNLLEHQGQISTKQTLPNAFNQ